MRPSILLASLFILISFKLSGQGVSDAILYSQSPHEGTGRNMAMGGATGAMGGDASAVCINPAGLGIYRNSEMTFTTGLQHTLAIADYYDNTQYAGKARVTIPNFGYVLAMECSNYKPLRFLNFSVALTRTNDHSYKSSTYGFNPKSSFIDSYLQTIDGIDELFDGTQDPETFLRDNFAYTLHPAWRTYLIDRFQDSTGFFFDSPIPQGHLYQSDIVESKGRSEEWTFSTSANFKDRFFIGASLGLAHLKRISTRTYQETPEKADDPQNNFSDWSFSEDLEDNAWGVNAKLGILFAPAHWLRFGVSAKSRTYYSFDESWSTLTSSNLTNNGQSDYYKFFSPTLDNDYTFSTPATYTASVAFLIGQTGMVTADAEYLNYGKSQFSSNLYSFSDVNNEINELLKPTFNLRIGTEWRMRQYYVRGGTAYYGSPMGFGRSDHSVKKLSLGVGYVSLSGIHWDFAYELSETGSEYSPYLFYINDVNVVAAAVQQRWRNKLVATMKIKL